jgi:hypothetical protein
MLSKKIYYLCISVTLFFIDRDYGKYDQTKEQAIENKSIPCGYNYNRILNDTILNSSL